MEREVVIKTPDGFNIYGTLALPEEKSEKLVIFVHGFTGDRNEHIFFNGAKFLKANSIASFRFDLYSWQKDARTFTDCDIQTHVDDLCTVFDHFKDEYKKIYLVGHSWGGIVVLHSELTTAGIILWDCSHPSNAFEEDEYKYNEMLGAYLLYWGNVYVVGKKMHDETLNMMPAVDLVSWVKAPIKVICAGNGVLIDGGKNYFELAKEPKAFVVIEGAGHTFDEEGTEEKLFQETHDWIDN